MSNMLNCVASVILILYYSNFSSFIIGDSHARFPSISVYSMISMIYENSIEY